MGIKTALARIRQMFSAELIEPSMTNQQPSEDAEADNAAAGAIQEPDKYYTAVDFIDMYLELKGMSPQVADWHRLQRAVNPPRYYRYRQLVALYWALGMTESVQAAERGDFIQYRPLEQYPLLTQDVRRLFERKSAAGFGDENELMMHHHDVQRIYQYSFEFVEVVAAVEQFNSGWLEASSVTARYMIAATNRYRNRHNKEHIARLKRLLASIIDPTNRRLTRQELVREYGFPNVNLRDIDFDWL